MIGAALTAAVILAPATTFAGDHHEPRPSNGLQLAFDIVNLVRAVIEPRPAPVIVEPPPALVERTVVIPEYDYLLYENEYIPFYEGWLFRYDEWHWVGDGPRPIAPPRWTPPPRHRDHRPHRVIVLPDHHRDRVPFPAVHRHEEPRRAPAPAVRHEEPRRAPVRTVTVPQEKKAAPQEKKAAPQEKKAAPQGKKAAPQGKKETKPSEPQKKGAAPAKKR